MTEIPRPRVRPAVPCFSSGPCTKRPGWSVAALDGACVGRSHRSKDGLAKLAAAIDSTRRLLRLPDSHRLAIVPASDTGAFEMALWSLLGARGVDVFAWESFGKGWLSDVQGELKLPDVRAFEAPYGELPDLSQADADRDLVFAWNGTTSGVRVPDGGWISPGRRGLTLCDATSAVFAQPLPWSLLDVVTFSWQKALGGEAAHGMLILGPRAVARLESYTPPWPIPKLLRLAKKGKVDEALFAGSTINTPSLLAVEDWLDAVAWAESIGGLPALHARADANLELVADWVAQSSWAAFLARAPATRSNTSVCLRLADSAVANLTPEAAAALPKTIAKRLEAEGVAFDVGAYRDAPPGLRIWCGATVESGDVEALLPWLDWAYRSAGDAA